MKTESPEFADGLEIGYHRKEEVKNDYYFFKNMSKERMELPLNKMKKMIGGATFGGGR